MTTDIQNHYEFVDKPSFPVVGKIYPDSIDWAKNKIDGYALRNRYEEEDKSLLEFDRARKPKKQYIISVTKRVKSKRI